MTSTTSAFGDALKPPPGAPAAWIDERVAPAPKNIYGVTKTAAEDLCQLFHRNERLATIVLRTSRFFPEEDDDPEARAAYADDNSKANEYLFRRVAIEDVVDAHLAAAERAPAIGFGKYVISATTPFLPEDCARLRADAPAVVSLRAPGWEDEYARRGWRMFPSIDRVYDNALARRDLGWRPKWDFAAIVERLARNRRHPRTPRQAGWGERLSRREVRGDAVSGGGKTGVSEFAVWRRLDRPGRDAALLRPQAGGWLLQGAAAFDHDRGPATVAYQVEVDARWEARRGTVSGYLGDQAVRHEILRDDLGWRLDGVPVESLKDLVDLDYGFTPATNVLQLKRIRLSRGQKADVPAAWFDLDSVSLIELPQTYERRGDASYWYEAPTVPYRALLEIAPNGFVRFYPGLWRLVV